VSVRVGSAPLVVRVLVDAIDLAWTVLKVAVIHLGRALCGHDGIIHGGLIATVFDESLARNVSLATRCMRCGHWCNARARRR